MTSPKGQHLIGKVLGSCVLERLLGYGGSSAVFLARQQSPERKVAVKVFLPRTTMEVRVQRDFYRRFLREAEAASKLSHPNILPIYAYGEQDGLPYIVMPYMPGGTLSEYMSQRGPLSLEEAQWYLEQLAAALDYAHDQGCVHCDVKPANILLDSEGLVMLSDFGIARLAQTDSATGQKIVKMPDVVMGTPDYISPEQALGQPLDGRSDVYSLAVTLYFLLAKRLPFKADSMIALAVLHVHEAPPSLAAVRADVIPALDRVMRKALAKNPDDRFQTASAFSQAFADAVTESRNRLADDKKQVNVLATEAEYEAQPSIAIARPIVRIKPVASIKSRVTLFACAIMLILVAAVFASRYAPAILGHGTPMVVETVDPAHPDQLANMNNWPVSSTFFFDDQQLSYHVINKSASAVALALYQAHQYTDFRLTVTMTQVHVSGGTGYYGIILRAADDESRYYLFEISTTGLGQYGFSRYDAQKAPPWVPLAKDKAPSLLTAPGKSNTVSIEARGNSFKFQINGKAVGDPVTDTAKLPLTSGQIGLCVENQGSEVAFSHLYIDTLN